MSNIKSRILTSISLLLILYFSFENFLVLLLTLFFLTFLLLDEFNNIFLKIFKKKKILHLLLNFLITVYLFFFVLSILFFIDFDQYNNKNYLLFLISISISTDIGGYLFGKYFKGKKLTKISPNKTYSGLIGSFLLSLVVTTIFFKNLDLDYNYLLLTIIVSTISQIGDLSISFIKRKAKLKDTGKILPGHGGILDRVDGIIFALPIGLIILS
tara:strand:- start:1284 stop:1922 length:639 start_codon:yes stop_codon:yes gene_type:complete